MYCRNCGKELDDKAVVCVGCGVPPLKGCKYCQSCGKEVEETAEVCVSCGVKLGSPNALAGDDKTWAMLSHISMLVLGFLGPLLVFLIKGKESKLIESQSKEALNFAITWCILAVGYIIVSTILGAVPVIGWAIAMLLGLALMAGSVVGLVWVIMAAVQVNSGKEYAYPYALRLVK